MYRITMPQALTADGKPYPKPEDNPLNGTTHRRVGVTFGDGVGMVEEITHSQLYTFGRKGYVVERKGAKGYDRIEKDELTKELQRLNPKLDDPKPSTSKKTVDPKEVAKDAAEETKASK